jgi:hypothetical protein
MRPSRVLAAGLAVLAVTWAAGCVGADSAAKGGGIRLKPMAGSGAAVDLSMFQIRVVRIQHRLAADTPVEDLWRLLGGTSLPYEKRALWEVNDLRIGDGAELAADRLSELVTETPDRSIQTSQIRVRENSDFTIEIGGGRDVMDILWTDAARRLQGRQFQKCTAQFRLVCTSAPDDPAAIRVSLAPEIVYGDEALHWVRTPTGMFSQRLERSTFVLSDFAAEVRLPPGRLLVLGGRPEPGLSPGGALFCEPRGPNVWNQTIVLSFERVKVEPVPVGESVPLVPPPTKAPASTGAR